MALANQKASVRRRAAVEIGFTAIRAVEVEIGSAGATLLKRGSAPLPEGSLENMPASRGALAQAIRSALTQAGISSKLVSVAIPRRLVTVKTARLPHAPAEAVAGMVQFEAQQYIPFQLEDVVLDHQVLSDGSDDMMPVMIVAARRTLVEEILAACDTAGIEVRALTVSSFGLAEYARTAIQPQGVVEIEAGELDIAVVGDGKLLFSRSAILPAPEASGGLSRSFSSELTRSIAAYDNENRGHPVASLLFGGPSAGAALQDEVLRTLIDIPLERLNGKLLSSSDPEAISFATAVGVAMADDPSAVCRINLVPASRTEKKEAARRRIQTLIALAVAALVLFLAFDALSSAMDRRAQERQEAMRMNDRLTKAKKAHDRVKKDFEEVASTYDTVSSGLARDLPAVAAVKAVSDSIPAGAGVYLTQLNFERNGSVAIHGSAKTESAVTQLVTALQDSSLFTSVRIGYMGETQSSELVTSASSSGSAPAAEAPQRVVTSSTSFIINAMLPGKRPTESPGQRARPATRNIDEANP